jgi:hypothetical protein
MTYILKARIRRINQRINKELPDFIVEKSTGFHYIFSLTSA